jgi:uncharacterized protein
VPLLQKSSYPGAPFWQYNGHLQTLVPGIFRRVPGVSYTRERIDTPDGDFLDLDWIRKGYDRLVVLTHGLEGSSDRQYIRGMAKIMSEEGGCDVLAWNCRSCSGEMNRAFRLYHHGDTADIGLVIDHAISKYGYTWVGLAGFSMGGNITMKYLGTKGEQAPPQVKAAVVFSAPCDLESASVVLGRRDNVLYRLKFHRAIEKKLRIKDKMYPGRLDVRKFAHVREWRDFDEWFSAPVCGYRDANEFYAQSSARFFIDGVHRPLLLINALNDPILTPECMPIALARNHEFFHLELPETGGHCGFMTASGDNVAWSERRALAFLELW